MTDSQHDLLIIYTSKNGRTGSMVEPIRQGMVEGGASVAVRTVEEVRWDEMLTAKGIIVGTPVRFGDVDWQIKRLFDITTHQDYPGPLSGKVGGAFTGGSRPGSGAELALLSMLHILLNHGMEQGVLVKHAVYIRYHQIAPAGHFLRQKIGADTVLAGNVRHGGDCVNPTGPCNDRILGVAPATGERTPIRR